MVIGLTLLVATISQIEDLLGLGRMIGRKLNGDLGQLKVARIRPSASRQLPQPCDHLLGIEPRQLTQKPCLKKVIRSPPLFESAPGAIEFARVQRLFGDSRDEPKAFILRLGFPSGRGRHQRTYCFVTAHCHALDVGRQRQRLEQSFGNVHGKGSGACAQEQDRSEAKSRAGPAIRGEDRDGPIRRLIQSQVNQRRARLSGEEDVRRRDRTPGLVRPDGRVTDARILAFASSVQP